MCGRRYTADKATSFSTRITVSTLNYLTNTRPVALQGNDQSLDRIGGAGDYLLLGQVYGYNTQNWTKREKDDLAESFVFPSFYGAGYHEAPSSVLKIKYA